MEITIFLRCYNYTLNGKWFKNNDEMTNLGEYNFTQNISLSLYQLNEKMDSISILVKNKNDGRYMDHLVTTGQISSVYAMPLSLYTLEDIHIIACRQLFCTF